MSPHAVFQAELTVEIGRRGEQKGMRKTAKSYDQSIPWMVHHNNMTTLEHVDSKPHWNMLSLVQWQMALSLQYHTNSTDQKLLFVVSFVKLHLTALKPMTFNRQIVTEVDLTCLFLLIGFVERSPNADLSLYI